MFCVNLLYDKTVTFFVYIFYMLNDNIVCVYLLLDKLCTYLCEL